MGAKPFGNCRILENINVAQGNPYFSGKGNCLINLTNKTLIAGGVKSVIPNDGSVEIIGNSSFWYVQTLKQINIPASVKTIEADAFSNCTGLTKVIVEDVSAFAAISFPGTTAQPLNYAKKLYLSTDTNNPVQNITINASTISKYAFYNCTTIKNVVLSDSITSIGTNAFYGCTGLQKINIPNSITMLDSYTFSGCSSLQEINIPATVTTIKTDCFKNCTSLNKVVVHSMEQWMSISFGNSAANPLTCGKNLYLTSDLTNPVTTVTFTQDITSKYVFEGCTSITSVTIAEGVTTLGAYSLYGFKGLTTLTLPSTLTTIGNYAFANCSNLRSLIIPNSVTSLGSSVFSGCSSLTSVQLPNTITSIGSSMFNGCSSLASIDIPSTVTSIGTQAFYQCSKLTSVTIPNSVQSIGKKAFMGCSKLTNLDLGNGVTTIYNSAFRSCSALTTVVIPASVTKIYGMVFASCTNLTNVTIESTNLEVSTHDSAGNDCYSSIFEGCSKIVTTVYDNGKYIGNSTNPYMVLMSATSTDIASIQIHPQTKIINAKALYNCKSITEIIVPDSVEYICQSAFGNCSAVTSITIGSGVKRIEHGAFPPKDSITSIVFKDPNDWGIANGVRVNLTSYSTIYNYLYTKRYRSNNWDKGRTSSYGEGHSYTHAY